VGQFGSDIVFLRHASGTLTAHENNCYVAVTEEQEALARSVFKLLPDDEEPEKGYSDPAGVHETGFVIENSASKASTGGPSVAITVYSRKKICNERKTIIPRNRKWKASVSNAYAGQLTRSRAVGGSI
jgi:hypothetical protein